MPEEKLKWCLGLLKRHGLSKKITVKQLESLASLLNFACSVIAPGRPFLCRMYSLMAGMRRCLPYFTLMLTKGVHQDMQIWETFLEGFNRKSMFLLVEVQSAASLHLSWQVGMDWCKLTALIQG